MFALVRRRFVAVAGAIPPTSIATGGEPADDERTVLTDGGERLRDVPAVSRERTRGGEAFGSVEDAIPAVDDDGFLLVGTVRDEGPATEGWAAKLAADGALEWERSYVSDVQREADRRFGPVPRDGLAFALPAVDGDGYLLAGWTYFDGTAAFVARLRRVDADGIVRWERSLGDLEGASGYSYLADGVRTNDGYLLCGIESPGIMLGGAGWVVAVDADGTVDWHRRYPATDRNVERTVREDTFRAVIETDEGYVLGGDYQPEADDGRSRAWLVGVDGDGAVRWDERFDVGDAIDRIYDLEPTDDGFLAVGAAGASARRPREAFVYDDGLVGDGFVAAYDDAGERDRIERLDGTPLYAATTEGGDVVAGGHRDGVGWVGTVEDGGIEADEPSAVRSLCPAREGGIVAAGRRSVAESYRGWLCRFETDTAGGSTASDRSGSERGSADGPDDS